MTLTAAAHHAAHASPVVLALVAFVAAALYAVSVLGRPTGRCRRCKGVGVIPARITGRPRPCPRCKGTGLRRRLAATAAHRTYWSIRHERARTHPTPHPED